MKTLVITIIIMLVLAGVSINALVGENGVITQAQRAKEASEKANIMELLETEFMKYNIDTIVDGDITSAANAMSDLVKNGIIDNFMSKDGSFTTDKLQLGTVPIVNESGKPIGKFKYVVGKGQYTFCVFQNEDGTFTAEESDIVTGEGATGGTVSGGLTLVTSDTFTANDTPGDDDASQKGKYTITGNANVIFTDKLEGKYSIYVTSDAVATISIFKPITLSNKGIDRSAIDIEPGGVLNLWIGEEAEVIVDSGSRKSRRKCNRDNSSKRRSRRLCRNTCSRRSNIKFIRRRKYNSNSRRCWKWWKWTRTSLWWRPEEVGAGAGIGGHGGRGGDGAGFVEGYNKTDLPHHSVDPALHWAYAGHNGENGQNCGNIKIEDELTVTAIGGGGGSGRFWI